MTRLFVITFSVLSGLLLYILLRQSLLPKGKERNRDWVRSKIWLHPNSICVERTILALIGLIFYFATDLVSTGIFLFTIAAFLDAVDGMIARVCDLSTKMGEELDPLCDKLTYLPALWLFVHTGFLSFNLMLALTIVEFIGQFAARWYLKKRGCSPAATKAGKTKAVLCFALVIYCALLDDGLSVPDYSGAMLWLCLIMAIASPICKIPWSVKK